LTKYDIHMQPVPESEVEGFRCMEFGYAAPLKVSGFQALIARWTKTLLTPRGSNVFDREEGTDFGGLVGANISRVSTGIRDLVALAVEDANEQVREQDTAGFRPDTEKLLSGELLRIEEGVDGVAVWVRLTNVAGSEVEFRVITV